MINGKSVIGVIPARGGSKGLPGKNVRILCGKPLIAWTIEAARASVYIDALVLSSDDEDVIAVARRWECEAPFVRPAELAQDDSSSVDVVLHALSQLQGYEYVVMLQPTSPLRTSSDIDACLEIAERTGSPCVSVTETEKSPYWVYTVGEEDRMRPVLPRPKDFHRRQTLPKTYSLNGAVYVSSSARLKATRDFIDARTVAYVMPRQRSVDIDALDDFLACERVLASAGDS